MRNGRFTLRAGIVLALWGLLGLGLVSGGTARAADNNAFVRVVQANTADEHVDVFINHGAQPQLTGFTFSNVTDYLPFPAGTLTFQVAPTGQGAAKSVITQSISVQAGAFYSVAIIGSTSVSPGLVVFTDGTSVPTDQSALRVYNLSSDSGSISVSSAGKTVISDLPFKSASNYLTFAPNQSIFQVTLAQPNKNNAQQTLDATFQPNMISSAFALGLTDVVDSIGFKFVTKVTASVPTGLPPTGFAPKGSSNDGIPPSTVYVIVGLASLALLGGTRRILARNRKR